MGISGRRTWKPTTAGILNIITGALNAVSAMGLIIAIIAVGKIDVTRFLPPEEAPFIEPIVGTILIVLLVLSVIEAVFPIIGGVFALQRRGWGWALAGSIIAILRIFPLGVTSTILVAMAKDEFES
jgi:hypothetical protein